MPSGIVWSSCYCPAAGTVLLIASLITPVIFNLPPPPQGVFKAGASVCPAGIRPVSGEQGGGGVGGGVEGVAAGGGSPPPSVTHIVRHVTDANRAMIKK